METPISVLQEKDHHFTIKELTEQISTLFGAFPAFRSCWVCGEVSKPSIASSGHLYFDLKDGTNTLSCRIWKNSSSQKDKSLVQQGAQIEVHGKIDNRFCTSGYAMSVDRVLPAGKGARFAEYERVREQLTREGLFDASRKRPLPAFPKTIGIVTSATGAVRHDMAQKIREHWPLVRILLSPARVQGDTAPADMIRALDALILRKPDVIIIGRGGGSMDDLWCFNDEALVRAVAACPIPIISAVGHETDFTLCDFGADLRALTPTDAAIKVVPHRSNYEIGLNVYEDALANALQSRLDSARDKLDALEARLKVQEPREKIRIEGRNLEQLFIRLENCQNVVLSQKKTALSGLEQRLEAVSPENVMRRGFAMVRREDHLVTSANGLEKGNTVRLVFHDGSRTAEILD